ncbi:MFS transporter [Roseomonas populi]|uniref:MFS transporter n=1 Tax=Roseomonas populi TaxID=3121582 RepID=A0ABT1X3R9_9PROT|nr:MFS transporter [Roseomonas pecuniae]MCR0982746.1 MFS transporter [Roseomonas pecuniae]
MTLIARPCLPEQPLPTVPARRPAPVVPRPPLRFRGWAVVGGSFVVQALCFGAIYSVPAFAASLRTSFGVSDLSVSLIYAVSGAMAFAIGGVSGPLADRFGARWPIALGMVVMASGFLLAAVARNFSQVLLCYGLLVGTGAGMAYVPAVAAVQRWFVAWRGLASGIATSGVGVGTALVPVSASLLALCGDWRVAFLITAVFVAVTGLLAAQCLARSPEACGLEPDGTAEPARRHHAPVPEGIGIGQALRERQYYLLLAGSLLLSVAVALPYADVVATARGAGLAASDALWLLSLIGIGSILGRLALGTVADRFGRDRTLLACCIGVAATMAWWAETRSAIGFILFALGFGLCQGGFVALLPSVVVDLYGRRSAGGLIGMLFTGRALSVLLGAPGMAALAAAAGHGIALWTACGLALLGTLLLSRALWPRRRPRGAGNARKPGLVSPASSLPPILPHHPGQAPMMIRRSGTDNPSADRRPALRDLLWVMADLPTRTLPSGRETLSAQVKIGAPSSANTLCLTMVSACSMEDHSCDAPLHTAS